MAAEPTPIVPARGGWRAGRRQGSATAAAKGGRRRGALDAGLARAREAEGLAAGWRALWVSRLLVWAGGLLGMLVWPTVSRAPGWRGFDPGGLTSPFGAAGDLLVAPAARWDSVWYLEIARGGYGGAPARAAFFPLYPLAVRALGAPAAALGGGERAYVAAGVAISLAALLAGLVIVHRLGVLDLGPSVAGRAVWLLALFPTAFAFSAVYSESLFLALSAGTLYAGRLGRWRWAGVLGGLAAATRSTGLLLVVPLVLLYLYGPRADRPAPGAQGSMGPRHPVRADLAWVLLVPAGLAAYMAHLALVTGDPLSPFSVGHLWYRHLSGPLGGAWEGAVAAFAGARQLLSGSRAPVFFTAAGGDPFFVAAHNLGNLLFLMVAVVGLVAALRRLPLAYGAWALCGLIVAISFPVGPEPLASLPRYLAVLFPLHMGLAAWLRSRRATGMALGLSAAGLVALSGAFAAWQWVA